MSDHQFILLAKTTHCRQILRCSHGTVHLVWQNATLQLTPAEFEGLVMLLRTASTAHPMTQVGIAPCCVFHDMQGYYHVLLGDAGLHLSEEDFLLLLQLADVALERLKRQPSAGDGLPPSSPDSGYSLGTRYAFSAN